MRNRHEPRESRMWQGAAHRAKGTFASPLQGARARSHGRGVWQVPAMSGGVLASSAVRLHTDGASRGNPGPAAVGVLIERTEDGAVLDEIAEYLGETTNNVAEYRALIAGLRRAAELGATEVEVWSDSELMVRQMQGRYQVKHAGLLPLYREASGLARRFPAFRIEHTLRGGNRRADALANAAIDRALHPGARTGHQPAEVLRDGRAGAAQPGSEKGGGTAEASAKAAEHGPASAGAAQPGDKKGSGTLEASAKAAEHGPASAQARAGAADSGVFVDVFALVAALQDGGMADVGGGLRLVRVAPGQSRVAAWALVLRGGVDVGGRTLEPGQACRGGVRYRAIGDEAAVVLEVTGPR